MRSSCRLSQSLRCLRSSSSVTLGTPSTAVVLRRLPAPCLGSNRIKWHLKESRRASSLVQTDEPTIYALSTAPGRAAIAIIRVSGPAWLSVYQALCPGKPLPKPRSATLRSLHETGSASVEAQVLDSGALILYFPAPETSTGEDVLELHVHGGTAVVKAVLAAIPRSIPKQRLQLIRYAEPGEFTRRAFYNNRLDLLQIEALGDTLAADTEQQRRLAVRGSTSVLADRYDSWRQRLLYARGELEALIDFSEDQHFDETPTKLCASVAKQIQELRSQLKANIEGASRGELLRSGISIALVGAPNVGKSSLFNQIVGREAAIVSSEAGTTRDVVDVNVDIGGYFCRFGDLAGLRKQAESSGQIEREGMRRAKQRALTSDVVIAVLSATQEGSEVDVHVDPEVLEVLSKRNVERQRVVFVLNKADLFVHARSADDALARLRSHDAIDNLSGPSALTLFAVSCKDAQAASSDAPNSGGIQALLDGLTQLFEDMTITVLPEGQGPAGSNSAWAESLGATERQRLLLQQSLQHLETFLAELRAVSSANGGDVGQGDDGVDVVLAAESLRSAADCLAKVIGRGEAGDVEEVLGVVFEKFCVGK